MPHRSSPRRPVAAIALAGALAASGCASPPPPAERTVYVVREMPMVLASQGAGPTTVAAQRATRDDPQAEADRRAWLEEEYYRPRIQVVEQYGPEGRYVPEKQTAPERVIVVEREPSRVWLPPISLSLGYWGGHGGHHDGGWGWGLGWGFPLWYW